MLYKCAGKEYDVFSLCSLVDVSVPVLGGYGYLGIWLCPLFGDCGYGMEYGRFDNVTFVGDVLGLAFLWMEVHEPVDSYNPTTSPRSSS